MRSGGCCGGNELARCRPHNHGLWSVCSTQDWSGGPGLRAATDGTAASTDPTSQTPASPTEAAP